MTNRTQRIALGVTGFTAALALFLAIDRGGLFAWSLLLASTGLLIKIRLKPSKRDLALSIGLATGAGLIWASVLYYVISTYESGEVVELAIQTHQGTHSARLWVLDIGTKLVVYYDAEPHVAKSLLSGQPAQLTRAGTTSTCTPQANPVDALPKAEAERLLAVMETKYGNRMKAADVYYLVLGRPRDRAALVVSCAKPG